MIELAKRLHEAGAWEKRGFRRGDKVVLRNGWTRLITHVNDFTSEECVLLPSLEDVLDALEAHGAEYHLVSPGMDYKRMLCFHGDRTIAHDGDAREAAMRCLLEVLEGEG